MEVLDYPRTVLVGSCTCEVPVFVAVIQPGVYRLTTAREVAKYHRTVTTRPCARATRPGSAGSVRASTAAVRSLATDYRAGLRREV
jgi:hypothetical protein